MHYYLMCTAACHDSKTEKTNSHCNANANIFSTFAFRFGGRTSFRKVNDSLKERRQAVFCRIKISLLGNLDQ